MYREIVYLIWRGEPDMPVRYLAILALLADTVTTLYALYISPRPLQEFNPVGAVLLDHGFGGEIMFMAIPLLSILLFLYLPGLLGDTVAFTNVFVHGCAAAINLLNITGLVFISSRTLVELYTLLIIFSTGIGFGVYVPALLARQRQLDRSLPGQDDKEDE